MSPVLLQEIPTAPALHAPNMGLGRHIEHDPESWNYPAAMAAQLVSVRHERHCDPFEQGELGSCTMDAALGMMMTDPFFKPEFHFTQADVITMYRDETAHDRFPGEYPPDDTGSSGLAAMQTLKRHKLITGYSHSFGLKHMLRTLVKQPVCIGVPWLRSMDHPSAAGELSIDVHSGVRGGHEIVVDEIDVEHGFVWITNSWGNSWAKEGRAAISWRGMGLLLAMKGDVVTGKLA